MVRDDVNPDRRPPAFGDHHVRERYTERTVRGITVATIQDRYNDDAWIRSTLVVPNDP